jgi:hypothetical protein
MTLYRLPDNLGGREVDCTLYEKDGNTWLWFSLDGTWMVHVREEALTKVVPPLPPEPADGTDWLADTIVFSRRDGWHATRGEQRWYSTDGD